MFSILVLVMTGFSWQYPVNRLLRNWELQKSLSGASLMRTPTALSSRLVFLTREPIHRLTDKECLPFTKKNPEISVGL